ncbi:MAG: hypothetical protein K2X11_16295 [Acetobacteraceae bacterium]|nr:hypothetical protein [Acetobacteraceae bacterium]
MRLRVIRASSMAEAMRTLRVEMGPDAVLLSSRPMRGGVELTAGIEDEDEDPDEPLLVAPPPRRPAASPDSASLAFHAVPAPLAARLSTGPLEATLEATLRFAPLPDASQPLLLVGPAGAGKTLTCAKLAARRVLTGAEAPLIISADGERAGGTEQLAGYARLMGTALAVALTPAALAKAAARAAPGQPVLIDAPGLDPFREDQARTLHELAAAVRAAVVLVLPAGLDAAEAADLALAFAALGATHFLPTRFDVTRRIGSVLAAAAAARLFLTEAGTAPGPVDGLRPLDPAWLAARLRRRSHLEPAPPEGQTA